MLAFHSKGLGQGALKGAAQNSGFNSTGHQTRESQREPRAHYGQEKNLAEIGQDPGLVFLDLSGTQKRGRVPPSRCLNFPTGKYGRKGLS